MTRPVAYIRRSTAGESNPGDASRDVQEAAIRELAHRDGFNGDVEYFVDWGRSADEAKVDRRTEYLRMLRLVEAGEVSVVYAYALDRLNRSLSLSARFAAACEANGVRIVTQREGEVRQSEDWLKWTILAVFSENELRTMKKRAAANVARRRARGDDFGYAPYGKRIDTTTHRLVDREDEDVSAVVEAYRRAGSFGGASALLNGGAPDLASRARPRRGETWSDISVSRVVRRAGAAPKATARGWSKKRAETAAETFPMYRLLVCPHDGARLIGMNSKSGNGKHFNRYFCPKARQNPQHPRPYAVAESLVLPDVLRAIEGRRAETGRATFTTSTADVAQRREALTDEKRRAGKAFAAGAMTDEDFDALVQRVDSDLAELPDGDDYTMTLRFTSGSPAALVERVELTDAMRFRKLVLRPTA